MDSSKNLYELLNVEKNATFPQIKKQYLKLAIILHPDKGGSEEEFKQLAEAYKILSDPEKRKLYDTYGKTEINNNLPKTDPFEMFTNIMSSQTEERTSFSPLDNLLKFLASCLFIPPI